MPNEFSQTPYSLAQAARDPKNTSKIVIGPLPKSESQAEHVRKKLGVIDRFSPEFQKQEFGGEKPIIKA